MMGWLTRFQPGGVWGPVLTIRYSGIMNMNPRPIIGKYRENLVTIWPLGACKNGIIKTFMDHPLRCHLRLI
jgi:hypothetical protein